jgi:ABC-2 type transport system permease protein
VTTLTGTGALARLAVRRDRVMLAIWVYALAGFVAFTVIGFKKLYPTAAGRVEFATAAGHNPAFLSLYGPLRGNSLGSLTAWRDAALGGLGIGLMSIFIVVRHTRADEETGRLELIGSAPVGRHAALGSALAVAFAANVVVGILIAVAAIGTGLPAAGSIAMAAGFAGCGLAFTGVAAVTAQLAPTGRSARGLAIGVLGAAFLLRAVGDSAGPHGPRWLSWLSPMGWAELVRAFGSIRWWILALPIATALILAAAGAALAVRRDYDAGVLPQRRGPAAGAASLRSPLAIAWRLQRATLLAWVSGALVYGVVIGSSAKGIGGLLGSAQVKRIVIRLGGQAALSDAYLAAVLSFSGLLAAGYAVSVVLRLRSEETEQRADPVLATGTGRIGWGLSHLSIAGFGTVAILVVIGLATGLGFTYRLGGGGAEIARLAGAGLAQAPAALVIAGIAAMLFGLAPRASVAGSWTVLGVVVLLLFLGATLQLSHWVLDISPFTYLPKLPGGAVSAAPLVWLSVIALALAAIGLAGLRRRDIG